MLLLFVYTISLHISADAGDEKTSASNESSPARLFHYGRLTEKQLESIVTIEINFTNTNTKNRTTVNSIYSNVHKELLKRLTSTKATTAATTFSISIATTDSISTTPTAEVTTIATTVVTTTDGGKQVRDNKRKKRQQTFDGVLIKEEDLRFVEVDPETDDNGILALSLLLDVKGRNGIDCGLILLKAANTTTEDGTLDRVARVSVVAIYRGFPLNRRTIMSENYDHPPYSIWPIVVIAIVVVLIVIVVVIIIWKKKQARKLEISGRKRSSNS